MHVALSLDLFQKSLLFLHVLAFLKLVLVYVVLEVVMAFRNLTLTAAFFPNALHRIEHMFIDSPSSLSYSIKNVEHRREICIGKDLLLNG